MSYILDALRKSEQERQRGKVPDLNSYKEEPVAEKQGRNFWPWITLVIIVINVVVAAAIWYPSRNSTPLVTAATSPVPDKSAVPRQAASPESAVPISRAATTPIPKPQPKPVEKPIPEKPELLQEPIPKTVVTDSRPPVQTVPTVVGPDIPAPKPISQDPASSSPAPSVAYMPQLEELPANERAGIPDMTFSSHMYSSIPRFRSIIINGKRLKEGEYFSENLQVREITDKGVIMSNGNVMFTVDVLGRWAQ